jgi:5-methylcytosine-specific restriction protein A
MARPFRSPESYVAERTTRGMLRSFLAERGFTEIEDVRLDFGQTQSQTLKARDEQGREVALWVRLCWRKSAAEKSDGYSAAQITARLNRGDWIGTLQEKIARQRAQGATHLLMVQRAGNAFLYAAAIPLNAVLPIWEKQRDESERLMRTGKISRQKNHAMNGSSPTLWLRDDNAPTVARALWRHRGVRDLAQLPLRRAATPSDADDSMDDLPGADYSALGHDGAARVLRVISGVPRDPRVRAQVRKRSNNCCERAGCGEKRDYAGFIDVHHIFGAEKNDRVWTCVALCPNCHREAHLAPDRDQINAMLLSFASRWAPKKAG